MQRLCRKCGIMKEENEFYKDYNGYKYYCKQCSITRAKEYNCKHETKTKLTAKICHKKHSATISDAYVKMLLKNVGYDNDEITQEDINRKRENVIMFRKKHENYNYNIAGIGDIRLL